MRNLPKEGFIPPWNCQIFDEESTGGKVIPLIITSSWKRNPQQEWDFTGNSRLLDEESTRGRRFRRESPAQRPIHTCKIKMPGTPNGNKSRTGSIAPSKLRIYKKKIFKYEN
jgi:hypothetical protein